MYHRPAMSPPRSSAIPPLLVALALAVGCDTRVPESPPGGEAELKQLADEAEALSLKLETERRAAIVAAKDTIVPRPDLGKCPINFHMPGVGPAYQAADSMDFLLGMDRIAVVD